MKKTGRPLKEIPADEVLKLAGFGCTNTEIADFFGVNEGCIRKRFSETLSKGRSMLKMRLRKKQIEVALKGNAVMLIFLGKNLLGQSDKQELEHSGKVEHPSGVLVVNISKPKAEWLREAQELAGQQKQLESEAKRNV